MSEENSHESDKAQPKTRRKNLSFTEADLNLALTDITNGSSVYSTSRKFNIPQTTLQRRKNGFKSVPGKSRSIPEEIESRMVSWIKINGRRGAGKTKQEIIKAASNLLRCVNRDSSAQLTTGWYQRFMGRHPDLASRVPQPVTRASAVVSETDVRKFHKRIHDWLEEDNLLHLLNKPDHILNSDEVGFDLNPMPKKVTAERGEKTVSAVESSNPSKKVSAMFTFSADGSSYTPQLIYKSGLRKIHEIYQECRRKFFFRLLEIILIYIFFRMQRELRDFPDRKELSDTEELRSIC